jgi:hypothetical protein
MDCTTWLANQVLLICEEVQDMCLLYPPKRQQLECRRFLPRDSLGEESEEKQ